MKLPAYPRTKPSGVEWLGDVPVHWNICAVWHVFSLGRGRVISHEDIREDPGEYPVYSSQTENDGVLGCLGTYDFEGDYVTWTTDGANAGTVFRRTGRFNCTNVCGTLKATDAERVDTRFAAYALNLATGQFVRHDINPKLMNNVMAKIRFGVASIAEQRAIAAFLDRETGRVDRLVAKKRELIERLKEKRTALISRTVTRGLPPAAARGAGLPENPPLKPSGVAWLGDIPAHWEVKKFGYISIVVRGASPRPAGDARYFDGDFIPWITVGEVTKDDKVFLTETETMLTEEGAANSRTIRSGTLVLTNSGATLGVPKILAITGCANDGVVAFEGLSKDANKFFLYFFLLSLTENLRDRIKQGSGQPNLNTEIVKALCVPFPPLPEQAAIAAYLDEETAKLDTLVGKVEEAVERLQEYRTALITAAVTGKIDVRGGPGIGLDELPVMA